MTFGTLFDVELILGARWCEGCIALSQCLILPAVLHILCTIECIECESVKY